MGLIKSLLANIGFEIRRVAWTAPGSDMRGIGRLQSVLEDMRARGMGAPRLKQVVDYGANDGRWTREFLDVFPGCPVLMLESQPALEEQLKRTCEEYPDARYCIREASEVLKVTLAKQDVGEIGLMHINVPGQELTALKEIGALNSMEAIIVKTSLFSFIPGQPLASQLIDYLARQDFQIYDICGFGRRMSDGVLSDLEIIFANDQGFLRRNKGW